MILANFEQPKSHCLSTESPDSQPERLADSTGATCQGRGVDSF